LLTPRFYSASNYDDLDLVVKHIKSKYPDCSIFAIGISYGTVCCLKSTGITFYFFNFHSGGIKLGGYLSQKTEYSYISNAMIVSVPYNGKLLMPFFKAVFYFFVKISKGNNG
jgi:predicted alpha/beta-fold hydrolase